METKGIITEQGDLGLGFIPVSSSDDDNSLTVDTLRLNNSEVESSDSTSQQ